MCRGLSHFLSPNVRQLAQDILMQYGTRLHIRPPCAPSFQERNATSEAKRHHIPAITNADFAPGFSVGMIEIFLRDAVDGITASPTIMCHYVLIKSTGWTNF